MNSLRKYCAEFIGTFVLVLMGCGSAYFIDEIGILGVAMGFGLSLTCMAYAIGGISGCHINPAVSLAMFIRKRLSLIDLGIYCAVQCAGAILAVFFFGYVTGMTFATGAYNDLANMPDIFTGTLTEIVLTFIFVFTIMGVTSKREYSKVAGIVIGLALTLVHILGINLTGTSVNPARSLAPAIYNSMYNDLWVFIIGPFVGAALAALAAEFLFKKEPETEAVED